MDTALAYLISVGIIGFGARTAKSIEVRASAPPQTNGSGPGAGQGHCCTARAGLVIGAPSNRNGF
jgi:hypothetical protein